ncbi:Endonuclease/exonuclease/phosphatase [Copromyces sp. CBS 386.78]|nr:Endonuclease/exonuclease/phosphatase [Copromyces sp. CBS 386.78]
MTGKKRAHQSTSSPPGRNSFRLFSRNIDGLKTFLPPFLPPPTNLHPLSESSPSTLRAWLSRHSWPEVLFLQELKISGRKGLNCSLLYTPLNAADTVSDDRTYTLDTVLPRDRQNCSPFAGCLYGVATIMRKDFVRKWVATVREVDWDIEARVSVVEMRGGLFGGTRPHLCPETGAVHPIYPTRNDRLRAFYSLLRDECLSLEARGFHVVVAGDFFGEKYNKRARAYLGGRKQDVKKVKCLDAVDVFRAKYGMEKRYTSYSQSKVWGTSCNRVDMVFVSKQFWEDWRVTDTGILNTPEERGPSNHVPIWAEIAL